MAKDESQLDAWPVEEQAAYWLRVLEEEPTPENHAAFDRWIASSPTHVTEFAQAQDLDDHLHDFVRAQLIDVDALVERARQEHQSMRRRNWAIGAAASAACVIVLLALSITFDPTSQKTEVQSYATTTRQDLIHLEDGSKIALNAQSAVRAALAADARDTYLDKGQANFRVRHDADRPFRVHTEEAVVVAVGTEFDVRVTGDRTVIAVIEGVVEAKPVAEGVKPARIEAGFSMTIHQDGRIEAAEPIDPAVVTAWRRSEEPLEFTEVPLAAIVRTVNYYSAAPNITIVGDDLAQQPYTLVLQSASTKNLINLLAEDQELEVVQQGDDVVIRQRND